jgi:myo-inositol 2-dehydrogenase/D-chiro-inositol 1-dehydrogenase
MSKIKLGLIGCGKQAPKHISGLKNHPEVEIVLADIESHYARNLAEKENLTWAKDPGEIFNDPSISAVDISTPTTTHFSLIQQAVNSGKHFFCEKPLCESLDEARKIERMVNDSGLIGMVGYIYRFAPIFDTGYGIFDSVPETGVSPILGKVVSAFFRIGGRGSHKPWKHIKETGGGAFTEMLVHMLDLAIWYFGPVQSAEVLTEKLLRPRRMIDGEEVSVDAEDYVLVRLEVPKGIEILLQADLITPAFTQYVDIQGDKGSFMGSILSDFPNFVFCSQAQGEYYAGKNELAFGKINLFEAQMAEFIHAVQEGRQPDRCTLRDSVLVMEAMEKIQASRK